jgi:hypothetical protein
MIEGKIREAASILIVGNLVLERRWNMNQKIFKYRLLIFVAALLILLAGQAYPVGAAATPIRVPADAEWVNTGIGLESGQTVYLTAEGLTITAPIKWYFASRSGPAGQDWGLGCGQYEGATQPCALDDAPYGALVGKVGPDGQPFLIGGASSFTAPSSGDLYLSVNDNLGFYNDNLGGFTVILAGK